jgi:hypothetical protein
MEFKKVVKKLALLAALVLSGTATTHAENAESGIKPEDAAKNAAFVNSLFNGAPAPQTKTYACFVRTYDQAHLARHPLQKVNAMKLLVTSEPEPEAEGLHYSFRLGVRYRNKRSAYDSSGDCSNAAISAATDNEARLGCGVDCDGGGIDIGLGKDGNSTLIRLERIRIWNHNRPDEDASDDLVAGTDDKIFRLDRAGLEQCRALVTDRAELRAMRRRK